MKFSILNTQGIEVWDMNKPNQGVKVFIYEGEYRKKKFKKIGLVEIYKQKDGTVKEKMSRVESAEKEAINKYGKKTRRLTLHPYIIPEVIKAMGEVYKKVSGEPVKSTVIKEDSNLGDASLTEFAKSIYGGKR